ncbi:hypothetical protein HOY82DRAFT_541043 [Tuber indicum]|nr:hypothetical protein HOY82DRAFT_541043 [Tuber indicum]
MDQRLEEIEAEEERTLAAGGELTGSMVGRRRVAVSYAVGEAWERFSTDRVEVVRRTFRVVGLSLPIDGSEDHELSIKGLANDFLQEGLKQIREGEGEAEIDEEEGEEEEVQVNVVEENSVEEGGLGEEGVPREVESEVEVGIVIDVSETESVDLEVTEDSVEELNFHYV